MCLYAGEDGEILCCEQRVNSLPGEVVKSRKKQEGVLMWQLTFETTSLRRKLKGVDPTIRTASNGKKVREKEERITLLHRGLNSTSSLMPKFYGAPSVTLSRNQNLASRLHSFYHLLECSPDKNAS